MELISQECCIYTLIAKGNFIGHHVLQPKISFKVLNYENGIKAFVCFFFLNIDSEDGSSFELQADVVNLLHVEKIRINPVRLLSVAKTSSLLFNAEFQLRVEQEKLSLPPCQMEFQRNEILELIRKAVEQS